MALIKSISGIRGTIGGKPGDTLSPLDVVKFTAAYGTWLMTQGDKKKVVIGRDGRISGELVQRLVISTLNALGLDVIDLSFESIEEANKIADDSLHFFQHDMRLPFWINYFDYAFNLFTSFGYFRTRREHDNSIRTIAQSLKLGGVFVIDYLNVHYAEDHLKTSSTKEVDGVKFRLSRWHDEDHFYKQIQVEEKGTVLKHLFTEKVAKFSLGDFNDMFAYQGLQVQEVYGDYKLGHYDVRKSPRMIMIAKKIKH